MQLISQKVLLGVFATVAGMVHSAPLLPENLSYQEASIQRLIPYRDGVLAVSHNHAVHASFNAEEAAPVRVEGIQLLIDVEKNATEILFLGLSEDDDGLEVVLIEEAVDGTRRSVPVPKELKLLFEELQPSSSLRLVSTNNRAAAITGDRIWWFDKHWHSRELPKVSQFNDEFRSDSIRAIHYLDHSTLYAGWDQGEWGGSMLLTIDLSDETPTWRNLSGKPPGDHSGIPGDIPVRKVISPSKGHIWVATGSDHLGGTWRGLHHRDPEGSWRTLVDGEFEEDRGRLKFPISSSIVGLAADEGGEIYILAGDAGVFRVAKTGLERLFEHNFFYHSTDRGDDTVGCYPRDLAISRSGDIFVSTNNFGMLAFRGDGDQWSARQVNFEQR